MPILFPFIFATVIYGGLHNELLNDGFDAPIPDRCASFERAHDLDNREFCKAWRAEHHIVRAPLGSQR